MSHDGKNSRETSVENEAWPLSDKRICLRDNKNVAMVISVLGNWSKAKFQSVLGIRRQAIQDFYE